MPIPLTRNELRAKVRFDFQQKLLVEKSRKKETDYSIGGFFGNVKSEAGQIVRGIGSMLGMTGKAIIHPVETVEFLKSPEFPKALKMIGSTIVEEYKEYRHPKKKFYEEPISVFTDFLTIASLGGAAVTKVGTAAKLPGVVKAGQAITKVSKPIVLSKDIAKFSIAKIPGGSELLTALEQRSKTLEVLGKSQLAHLAERNKKLSQVDEALKGLTSQEKNLLIPYVEKTAEIPFKPTEKFQKAVSLVKDLAKEREEFLKGIEKITESQAVARKWQPVVKHLFGEDAPVTVENIAEARKLLKFSDDPTYVQHIFTDKPKKFSDFFINTAPVKNWTPGFLKRSKGIKGYSIDPNEVLKWEAAQTAKYKNNVQMLERIKQLDFVEPLDNIKNLKPGYKVFAPDGYIRFYQGTVDLVKEFTKHIGAKKSLKEVGDLWDDLKNALDSSLIEKKYVGVTTRVKLYQIPESSAKVLQTYAKTVNPYVRLFWDKPIDAFRFLALALTPRWLVNNVVGNTMLSIIAGDPFSPKGYLTYRAAKEQGLIPDEVFSGIYHTEKMLSGNLGSAAKNRLVGFFKTLGEAVEEAPIIKQIKDIGNASYKVNSSVDDFFRGAHYINQATKLAKKKLLQQTGQKLNTSIDLLKYAKQDPEILAKAVRSVDEFFYNTSKLSPFERHYVRRFLPFYSWYKFIGLYALRLPLEHPRRFEIISNLAKTFYQISGQDQLPPYMRGSVPVGESPDGSVYYLRTSGLNPFSLVEDIATQGVERVGALSAAPGIKVGLERATGREVFTGRTFTAKDIIESYGGRLYKVNQRTGQFEEVEEKVLPGLLEHLLRNFIPQYQLLEEAVAGGARRYTAEGLPEIISGEALQKSPITGEVKKPQGAFQKLKLRALGLLGAPLSLRTPEQRSLEEESKQRAASQLIGRELPALSPTFRSRLREEIRQKILQDMNKRMMLEGFLK